jgi:hypothetical protein
MILLFFSLTEVVVYVSILITQAGETIAQREESPNTQFCFLTEQR